jgi:multiple sugar transport system substrate-binding protein
MPDGTEKPWDWNTVAEIAKLMTIDVNGKNATEAGFDRTQIVQVGYVPQWQHAMHMAGFWGAGAADFYDPTTLEAHIPEPAKQAWKFYYDGMWGAQPFIATGALAGSPEFGGGNVFNSGKAAMGNTHFWYTCCLADFAAAGNEFQLAVNPANPNDGKVHARVDADTFRIWKGTPHPNEAFTVVAYLITEGAKKLTVAYGALPAIKEQQQAFLDAKSAQYPFVTSWQPILDGLAYPDIPSAEGYMPNYNESWNRVGTFGDLMANTEGLDMDAELATLEADLTVIFQKK